LTTPNELEELYTLPSYAKLNVALERGAGSFVWDEKGRRFLDFYGGHCVTAIGHCPPKVVEAIRDQATELIFYSNAVYSPLRGRAAKRLIDLCPEHIVQAFFCNSGTEANESALKMARKTTGRMRVIAMDGGFHGRTLGSLAVTSGTSYRSPYESLLGGVTFVPFGDLDAVAQVLASDEVAGVILEPIQSMAGVVLAEPEYYRKLADMTASAGALLIFDEVQTGVGRTGTFTLAEQLGVKPDVVTLAKSLGSGVPVGATVVGRRVADAVKLGDHGSTFGGGMIAMAAMDATLETVGEPGVMERASPIFEQIRATADEVGFVTLGRGCLIGIDAGFDCREIRSGLFDAGVLVGSSSNPNVMRLFPPLTTSDEEVELFRDALLSVVASASTLPN
jgi:acetylornithine/succinyldiaminopimelate/putrescine aminotransferase